MIRTSMLLLTLVISACSSIPDGARPVEPFDLERYLGKWYEIARLDFRFEKNLNNTTAEYTINDDGTVRVFNQGYDIKSSEWKSATGKARFADDPHTAMLKVSFFGPFYGGYNVIALDNDYQYALVAGSNLKYLWILSRETSIPDSVRVRYLQIAENIGYTTKDLVWVEHDRRPPDHSTD